MPFLVKYHLPINGVLFLDEIGEFTKKALDSLRQPLEDGIVTISRVLGLKFVPS